MKEQVKMRLNKKTNLIICLLLLSLFICSCGKNTIEEEYALNEDNKLIVYTGHKEEIYKPIIKEFEERTGIWVETVAGGTNQILEEIKFADSKGGIDIMFGGGIDSLMAYEDYFEPYITTQDENLDKTYSSHNHSYTVFSKLPIVFVYNTRLVLPSGAPRRWEQILDYQWKGGIAFADPSESGSSFTSMSFMVQELKGEYGSDEEVIKKLTDNLGGDLSKGSSILVEDVASGDKQIGIALEDVALKKKETDKNIDIIYPIDSVCAVPDGCAIVKGAAHMENAEKFMEFIVSDDVQHLLEDRLYRRSVRTDFPSSSIPGEVMYDCEYSIAHRQEMLSAWNACINNTKENEK